MQRKVDDEVRRNARVLWDYHHLDLGLRPADVILALGSHDERVAECAAQLMIEGLAPLLVPSGGSGKVTRELWRITEGDRFAEIARKAGVPSSKILIERMATNTGENITKARDLLVGAGISVKRGILVTKPYMRRRAYATAAKQWSEIDWLVASPQLSFDEYPDEDVPLDRMIQLMVGDLQRIKIYADSGFQIPQDIPDHVWQAYQALAASGFDKYVIKPEV
ncbi:MAG: YdcF family protein [Acidobacteriota bacterium]